MKSDRFLGLVVALAAILSSSGCRRSVEDTAAKEAGNEKQREPSTSTADGKTKAPEDHGVFLDRWDGLGLEKGGAGAQARLKVLADARQKLRGAALGAFIEGLHARREMELSFTLMEENGIVMFAGNEGRGTREWLLGVGDAKFKEKLCFWAGHYYTGPGLVEYMQALSTASFQDRFLAGYACRVAESDPYGAVSEFRTLKPKGVTSYPLKEIVARAPEETDFRKLSGMFAADFDKNNTLAVEIRAELLKRWVGFRPAEAADYVTTTKELVLPKQMAVVVGGWLKTCPDAAAEWLEKTPAGDVRDEGMAALAMGRMKDGDSAKAWRVLVSIGDPDKRVKLATEVFKEWEKKDHDAAVKAWEELFPPAR